jgi:hypothetical protein
MRRMPLCEQCRILTTNIACYIRGQNCAVFNGVFIPLTLSVQAKVVSCPVLPISERALLLEGS